MREQTRLNKEQTEALLEDRRIRIEESDSRRLRDQDKLEDSDVNWEVLLCILVIADERSSSKYRLTYIDDRYVWFPVLKMLR